MECGPLVVEGLDTETYDDIIVRDFKISKIVGIHLSRIATCLSLSSIDVVSV
jgi:hypothetical protein